jgi:hypothetical protein
MTDVVALAAQVSTPIKVAWLLWMIWIGFQVASYRWMRQQVPVSDPAWSRPAPPPPAATVSRPRRRRRRRLPPGHEPGAFQEIGA